MGLRAGLLIPAIAGGIIGAVLALLIVEVIRRTRPLNVPGAARACFLVASFAVVAACSSDGIQARANPTPADRQTERQAGAATSEQPSAQAALAGKTWRLVRIMSMDDQVYTPDEPNRYTLQFKIDGSAAIGADCNRGTGSWSSESAGQLQFGLIAASQALCRPGSLHDRYMAQFPWVRSYVIKDGRLFLATMADGSIIEFMPMPDQ